MNKIIKEYRLKTQKNNKIQRKNIPTFESSGPFFKKLTISFISLLVPFIFQLPPTKNLRPMALEYIDTSKLLIVINLQVICKSETNFQNILSTFNNAEGEFSHVSSNPIL